MKKKTKKKSTKKVTLNELIKEYHLLVDVMYSYKGNLSNVDDTFPNEDHVHDAYYAAEAVEEAARDLKLHLDKMGVYFFEKRSSKCFNCNTTLYRGRCINKVCTCMK
jgi:hypothetical protein